MRMESIEWRCFAYKHKTHESLNQIGMGLSVRRRLYCESLCIKLRNDVNPE